jgi:hypothetical protein
MTTTHLIPTLTICTHYNIEFAFINKLYQMGLIQIEVIEEETFIHKDHLTNFEKILRLHHDLEVNLEGVDVIYNFWKKKEYCVRR